MDSGGPISLSHAFERHLRAKNLSDGTVASYLVGVRQFTAFLQPRGARARGGDRADLEAFIAKLLTSRSAMDSIRAAFMAKWGRVPVLELYRQMAIRQQKAKNFEQALWWVERAIAIYGIDCARAEAVEDLQSRATSYRAKLNPQPRPPVREPGGRTSRRSRF